LSSDLYQAKFTYTLAKPFFPCRYNSNELRFNGWVKWWKYLYTKFNALLHRFTNVSFDKSCYLAIRAVQKYSTSDWCAEIVSHYPRSHSARLTLIISLNVARPQN